MEKLTFRGPRRPRKENREGGEKRWSCQNITLLDEGLLSGVSVNSVVEARFDIIRAPDPSASTINPGRKTVSGCGGKTQWDFWDAPSRTLITVIDTLNTTSSGTEATYEY